MEPNETCGPTYYNGRFRHGLDEKRRLQIPARWRPAKAGMEFTLVIWPKAKEGTCLRVLTPVIMEKMMQEIEAMPNSDPNKTVLKRYIGGNSAQVALDSAGRVCIPEDLAKAAAITDQVVLVGLMDRFEIWAPEPHDKIKAADEVMAQEAFKLMQ